MHVLITGGTGFIGEALLPALQSKGCRLSILTRRAREGSAGLCYLTDLSEVDQPVDAVINLAGASLAGRRWNAAYKREIIDSRLDTTRALGAFFQSAGYSPRVWLNASAIGYYGPRGDDALDENAAPGEGFAASLCQDWEAAAREAAGSARLCLMRLGVVFERKGGAYEQMTQPFRMGVANWIGTGTQWLSWVHRSDVVAAMLYLLEHDDLSGPVNLTAPDPVTSKGFCAAIKPFVRTWLTLPMPAPVMRAMVGEMADELLITGQRVLPEALLNAGFRFDYPDIETALAALENR